jgi:hypothetical protein
VLVCLLWAQSLVGVVFEAINDELLGCFGNFVFFGRVLGKFNLLGIQNDLFLPNLILAASVTEGSFSIKHLVEDNAY